MFIRTITGLHVALVLQVVEIMFYLPPTLWRSEPDMFRLCNFRHISKLVKLCRAVHVSFEEDESMKAQWSLTHGDTEGTQLTASYSYYRAFAFDSWWKACDDITMARIVPWMNDPDPEHNIRPSSLPFTLLEKPVIVLLWIPFNGVISISSTSSMCFIPWADVDLYIGCQLLFTLTVGIHVDG